MRVPYPQASSDEPAIARGSRRACGATAAYDARERVDRAATAVAAFVSPDVR